MCSLKVRPGMPFAAGDFPSRSPFRDHEERRKKGKGKGKFLLDFFCQREKVGPQKTMLGLISILHKRGKRASIRGELLSNAQFPLFKQSHWVNLFSLSPQTRSSLFSSLRLQQWNPLGGSNPRQLRNEGQIIIGVFVHQTTRTSKNEADNEEPL